MKKTATPKFFKICLNLLSNVLRSSNGKIELYFLISMDIECQIMKPKYLKDFLPLRTEFTESIKSSGLDCKSLVIYLLKNNSFKLLPE